MFFLLKLSVLLNFYPSFTIKIYKTSFGADGNVGRKGIVKKVLQALVLDFCIKSFVVFSEFVHFLCS